MPKRRKDMRLYEEVENEEGAIPEEDDLDVMERPSFGGRPGWRNLTEETPDDSIASEEGWGSGKLESLESLRDEEDQDWDE